MVALLLWSLLSSIALFYGAALAAQLEAVRADAAAPQDMEKVAASEPDADTAGASPSSTAPAVPTFIYWQGEVGSHLAEVLSKKAQGGVRVRVLLDAYRARPMDPASIHLMQDNGVTLRCRHRRRVEGRRPERARVA